MNEIEKTIIIDDKCKFICQILDDTSDKYLGYYLPELGATMVKLYRKNTIIKNHIKHKGDLFMFYDFIFNIEAIKSSTILSYSNQACYHYYKNQTSITNEITSLKTINNFAKIIYYINEETEKIANNELKLVEYNF